MSPLPDQMREICDIRGIHLEQEEAGYLKYQFTTGSSITSIIPFHQHLCSLYTTRLRIHSFVEKCLLNNIFTNLYSIRIPFQISKCQHTGHFAVPLIILFNSSYPFVVRNGNAYFQDGNNHREMNTNKNPFRRVFGVSLLLQHLAGKILKIFTESLLGYFECLLMSLSTHCMQVIINAYRSSLRTFY